MSDWVSFAKWPILNEIADHPFLAQIIDSFNLPDAWRFLLVSEYWEMPFD